MGGGVVEGEQAAALAEERVGVLGDVPELLPACGCFGVEGCGFGVVAGVLGELGVGGAERVLASGRRGSSPSVSCFARSGSPAASAVRSIAPSCLE